MSFSIQITLDTRRKKKTGKFPVKLRGRLSGWPFASVQTCGLLSSCFEMATYILPNHFEGKVEIICNDNSPDARPLHWHIKTEKEFLKFRYQRY